MILRIDGYNIEINEKCYNVKVEELGLTYYTSNFLYGKVIFNLRELAEKMDDIYSAQMCREICGALLLFNKRYSNNKLEDVFDRPIKHIFKISDYTLSGLHLYGVWSIADLVSTTQDKLKIFVKDSYDYENLIKQMYDKELPPAPNYTSGEKWLAGLKELKEIENNKNTKLERKELNMENKNENLEQIAEEKFYRILSTPIEKLNLTVRAYNVLHKYNIECVGGVVILSESEVRSLRTAGKMAIEDIKTKLGALNLELRPRDVEVNDWIKNMREEFVAREIQEMRNKSKTTDKPVKTKQSDLDINEIPEKYRETYAVGAMEMAKREMAKQGVREGIISRRIAEIDEKLNNLPHSNVLADKKFKLTCPKMLKNMNEMDDREVLEAVKGNVLLINDLQDSFVKKYAKVLIKIVLENSTADVEQRLKLLDLLYNANQKVNQI